MAKAATGLDQVIAESWQRFKRQRIGLVCHQASWSSSYDHIISAALYAGMDILRVFGPQHGPWGHTQDNMVEWEGYKDPRTGLSFVSLYGEHRKPTPAMLEGIDHLVIDLQDVGARYYTFIWTTALCLVACAEQGIPVTILDRPNPIDGFTQEGPGYDPDFSSFVGLYPLPVRHGLTLGEVALYINRRHLDSKCSLRVVGVKNWNRHNRFDETGLPWFSPSPNMPTPATALVYPGQCLLEATNLSEGRGTTQPFETCGAPYVDGWRLAKELGSLHLPGVTFRPIMFQPTFQKFAGYPCGGCFIHVIDPEHYEPVFTSIAILHTIRRIAPQFNWNQPPYEYEFHKMPIDILTGGSWVREAVDQQLPLKQVRDRMKEECRGLAENLRA